ncbi:MAG: glycosyltransferase, partial [Gammaproteobacteria bacterium]|nr:glycosyltransferase [Gammaproteobacteria bacterium]
NFRSAGGPVLYCEHAWLPRWSYQISPGGINADSHIAPFVWDGNVLEPQAQQAVEQHLADIRAGGPTQYSYMQTDVAAAEGMPEAFILVPLQMEWDTNIQRHVPRRYRNMQNLITDISRANPDLPVIFKQHPADVRRGSQQLKLRLLRSGDAIWPHNRGNIHRLLRSGNCKGIISLNSNVVHDGMIWDVPSITLGNNIWTRDGLGPFLRSFPEDWSELYMAWQDPPRRACRDAYAWYLLQNQWTMDDVSDAEKVAALFAGLRVKEQQSIRQARPQAPVTHRAARNKPVESRVNRSVQTTRLRREARLAARTNRQTRNAHNAGPSAPVTDQTNVVRMASRRLPVINITARDMGWFFEDLKQHFLRASGKQAVIKVSERPRRDADAWIYLRTKEAVSTPVPEQTLVQVHDMFSEKLYQPGGDRYCVQGCGGVVLTHPAQRELLAGAGINLEQKQVLDRPIGALSAFTLRDATTDPFTVAWVGRPAVHFRQDIKRIDWFVQALHKLESGFRAVLLGERMETQHAAIRKAGLDCVYYTKNKFPISCYPNLYKSFDCVVITSRSEAGPICLFESLASGVPVVSTRAGWSPLLIKDGENGYLVDSIDEIADAVNKIRHNFTDWFARRETIRNSLGGYTLESWVEDNIRSALTLLEGKTGARPHYGQPARRQHVRS